MMRIAVCACVAWVGMAVADVLPAGDATTDVLLETAGEYTLAGTSVQYKSLKSGAEGLTTLNLVGDPVPEVTLVGASANVFGAGVPKSTLWVKGGRFTFPNKGYVYIGSSSSSTANTRKNMVLTDGAALVDCRYLVVAVKEGGNCLAMTNASVSAESFYISNGGCQNSNRVLAGPGSSISVNNFTMEYGATSNTREPARFKMSGPNATLTVSSTALIGHVPGGLFELENGAAATIGTMSCGNIARDSNKKITRQGDAYNIRIADASLTCSGTLTVGTDAVTGISFSGTNAVIDADTLVIGGTAGANDHTVRFADSTVRVKEMSLGKQGTTGNTLTLEGAKTVFTHMFEKKVDIFGAGTGNRLVVRDGATLQFTYTRYAFQTTTGSSLEIENGGLVVVNEKPFHLGYGTTARELDCEPNRLVIGAGGTFSSSAFYLENVNSQAVVSNGTLRTTSLCHIGCDTNSVKTGCNVSTNCTLFVTGSSPVVDANGSFALMGEGSHLVFALPENGYQYTDSGRAAPIVVGTSATFAESAEIDVDASALGDGLRGHKIDLLVTGSKSIALPDGVLARANARGAASTPQYVLSCTSKVLSVTVKNDSGTLLIFR